MEFAAMGTLKQNYASILMLLLRLRQACDHPLLVKGFHTDTIGKDSLDMARQLPREMLINLRNQLEGLAICTICSVSLYTDSECASLYATLLCLVPFNNIIVPESAKLSVLLYHGGTRTKHPNELTRYHVVLTTYSIVTNEVPKQPIADDDEGEQKNHDKYGLCPDFSSNKKRRQSSNEQNNKKKGKKSKESLLDFGSGPLARVRWFRIILDEAQTIKNHRTQVARACCGLRAKRRWCLSGTPMQNTIDDLYSYFRFLKYDPYSVYSSFCASIKHPISRNASSGYKKLQAVLKTVLLRRTKGTIIDGEPILKLPPKSICLKKVEFSHEEREFYLKLEADSRQQFKVHPI
ncbi:hypothetical protein ZIOFF_018246 [Zingiber officinale]|uniref:Helicase ATP-binding domain-containing protein n=1 Tax=Zingiber officinale TaxID=94328 RepID=A0A8J5H5U3_ZINOF|nr:hypothetical protein ZIOFF_018246 [Zingiber officinale]